MKKLYCAQCGQSTIEYIVVTLFCVIVLISSSGEGNVIAELKDSIKNFFGAYSYAISVTPQ